jgi:ABC-2 type transport system ATP-binding protein
MQALFKEFCQRGNSVLLSTHLVSMAEKLCDRLIIMKDGLIQTLATPKELTSGGNESLEHVYLRLTAEAE